MQQVQSPPRYQAVHVSIENSEPGLQINGANSIHIAFPQRAISTIGLAVGVPRWSGRLEDAVALRVGWNDSDHQDLSNTLNSEEDCLWVPIALASIAAPTYRLGIAASATSTGWPSDTGSFRLKGLSVDGASYRLADWAPWIEEDTTCPGPGDQTEAPPTCIAFPGNGDRCDVCAAGGPDGIVGICPLVRRPNGFPYTEYMWHGRFYWCRESPF